MEKLIFCPSCKVNERQVSSKGKQFVYCKECTKVRDKLFYLKNREKVLKSVKEYWVKNKERSDKRQREYEQLPEVKLKTNLRERERYHKDLKFRV